MKRKRSVGGILFDILNTLLMLIILVLVLYPFWYVITCSLSTPSQTTGSLLLWPKGFTLESFKTAFETEAVYSSLLISVARSVLGSAGMLLVSGMAAYVLSKTHLIAGRFFRVFIIFTMYFNAGTIPIYLTYQTLGLTNTFWVYIIPMLVVPFNIVLMKNYMESIPPSMEEAVLIDGGNELTAYFRVILPICLPVNAAVILFSALTHWNSLMDTQLYNSMSPHLYTIQYVLYNTVAAQMSQTLEGARSAGSAALVNSQSLKMAFTVITIIPVMCVYPFLQKYFVSGIMIGSVKE